MNIIGGIYKGRPISMPKAARIRPTSNKAREALFNILGEKVLHAAVLDLFAGSGSLGLEALSRGAASIVFIDSKAGCIDTIKKNLKNLEIHAGVKIMQLNMLQALKKLSGKGEFDLVFLDPPYFRDWVKKTLIILDQYDIVKNLGLTVCEHHKKDLAPERVGRLVRLRQSRYSDTVLSFYSRSNPMLPHGECP